MKRGESGFSLIIAIMVLVVLTLLGMTVLTGVNVDSDMAGNIRASESALYLAEAGISWGMDTLRNAPYSLSSPSTDVGVALSNTLCPRITGDADCLNGTVCPIFGWRQLNNTGFQSLGSGRFRVVVSDDSTPYGSASSDRSGVCGTPGTDTTCGLANQRILMRSLGKDASGAQRLIEVAISNQ